MSDGRSSTSRDETKSKKEIVRRATKAGSWYEDDVKTLRTELDHWLKAAGEPNFSPARVIIAPHAGYIYSGGCAGYAYNEVDRENTRRFFILGPSHCVRLNSIALSPATTYDCPLGPIQVDQEIYDELHATGKFETMTIDTDENEHSLELQIPYISYIMDLHNQPTKCTIVPMMVGSLSSQRKEEYGKILSKYMESPENVFVISSDFCHWGNRFDYTHYNKSWGEIYQSVEKLDKLGMKAIKDLKLESFVTYLKKYDNTICGRYPISVMLAAVEHLNAKREATNKQYNIKFLRYEQSSNCRNANDSSVSYVAASVKEFPADNEPIEFLEDIVDV